MSRERGRKGGRMRVYVNVCSYSYVCVHEACARVL